MDIPDNCTFSNIVNFRQKKNKGKLTKEEKKVYLESVEVLDLDYEPEEITEEESEFMKAFVGGD